LKTAGAPVFFGEGRQVWLFVRGDEGVVVWPQRPGGALKLGIIAAEGSIKVDVEDTGLAEHPSTMAGGNCDGFADVFASRDSGGWTIAALGQELMGCNQGGLSVETVYLRRRTPAKWEGSRYPQLGGFVWRSSSEGLALLGKGELQWMGPRTGRLETIPAPLDELGGTFNVSLLAAGTQEVLVRGNSGWAEISTSGRIGSVQEAPIRSLKCVSTPGTWACDTGGSITFIRRPGSPLEPVRVSLPTVGVIAPLTGKNAVASLDYDRGRGTLRVVDASGGKSPSLEVGAAVHGAIAPTPGGLLVAMARTQADGGGIELQRITIEAGQAPSP
jgi:hypothetical protein